MKIYLAGTSPENLRSLEQKANILESFAYMKKHKKDIHLLLRNNFMLDSGAFTFIGDKKTKINWKQYTEEYAKFINDHDVELFFELDIYSVIGTKETENLRTSIESMTNKKSIPVWHIFLGIDYYKWMVKNYDYIAIGASGRHDSKWTRTNPEKLKALVQYAKKRGTKVHGLGYTVMKTLKQIPFHSVDSTTWQHNGHRFGKIYKFTGNGMKNIHPKKNVKNKNGLIDHNFKEWVKFQSYAESNL
jgi:hypothetical protein